MLLCTVCTGAWAQVTAITDIAQLEAGAAYNLRCFGGCGSPWMWDDAEASPTLYGHADYGSLFMFEAVGGGYYMKSLSSNKYVNVPNTDNQTLATLDDDASTIWTLVNVGDGIAIRPSGSNYGLNNNQDQNKIKLNASESGNPCSLWKFYKIEQKGWTPNLSNKSIANIAEKATSLTAATSAEDNNHWYLMTQTRGTETPVVATTSGERIKRSSGAVTQYTRNIQNYLVRLIPAGTTDGYYKLQFGNGLYFGSNQRTYADNTDAAVYSYDSEARASTLRIYNTTGSGTGFGINLTKDGTEYGKTLDNQGNGGNVVFWGQGQKQNNSGNDFWQFYPVELQEGENYYVRPTFVSSNSTETGSQEASKLCDENNGNPTGSKWGEAYSANPETKLYAIVRADNTILKEYVMFNGNDTHDWPGRRLTAWTLEGSNSQSGPWTLIDNKTEQTQNDANYGANAYSTESNEAVYSYYKLTLGAIDGNGQHADMFQISDLLFKVEEVPTITEADMSPVSFGDNSVYRFKSQSGKYLSTKESDVDNHIVSVEESATDETIFFFDGLPGDGGLHLIIGYCNGAYLLGDKNCQYQDSYTASANMQNQIAIKEYDGKYYLKYGTKWITYNESNAVVLSNEIPDGWIREEVTEIPLTMYKPKADEEKYYSSLYFPIEVRLPEGVAAYAADRIEDNYVYLNRWDKNGILAYSTAAIIYSEGSESLTHVADNRYKVYLSISNTGEKYLLNILWGNTYATTADHACMWEGDDDDPNKYFAYSFNYDSSGTVGFYKNTGKVGAFKAFFPSFYSSLMGTSMFLLDLNSDEQPTSINAINIETSGEGKIFSIDGRATHKAVKGINITNGKKLIIK